jgi:hypothetical protein
VLEHEALENPHHLGLLCLPPRDDAARALHQARIWTCGISTSPPDGIVKTSLQNRHGPRIADGPAGPPSRRHKVFLLSPAHCGGKRASLITRPEAAGTACREGASRSLQAVELARSLRSSQGAPLGEVFAFLSGLYFRGKMTYAGAFQDPPPGLPGALVITAGRGLLPPETRISIQDLDFFSRVPIDPREPRYRIPLERAVRQLADSLASEARVVLLGSLSTSKYVDLLHEIMGERLCFPERFVGMGDMQRGSVLLRAAQAGVELTYTSASGAALSRPRRRHPVGSIELDRGV